MVSIALTGGAGNVGRALRQVLSPQLAQVRIIDLAEPAELATNESWQRVDIADVEALTKAVEGVDAIVHLAGYPNDRPVADMLRVNVLGSYNIYEAARRANVGRVVLGSSNHVVGFYPRDTRIGPDVPMRPDGLYGLGKCWAELAAGIAYDKLGIRSLIIRIGNAQKQPTTPRSLLIWISPRDLAQLTLIGLTHPDIDCTVVYGVSGGGGEWYDNSVATALGYRPVDQIIDFAHPDAFVEPEVPLPPITNFYQGGPFCAQGHDGVFHMRRPLPAPAR